MLYKRILLKMSGEVLMGEREYGIDVNFVNGVMYKYHISLSDAIRLGASWRKGEFGTDESLDRFSTYSATKSDLDFRLGYERKYNMGPAQLFGGFPGSFLNAYQSVYPLNEGFSKRIPLWNLYHILNHLNLFGGHYYHSVMNTIQTLSQK